MTRMEFWVRNREYLVFHQESLDRFMENHGADWMTAVLADKDALKCFGRLIVRDGVTGSGWEFKVLEEVVPGLDMRHHRVGSSEILRIGQGTFCPSTAVVNDITITGQLEGIGVSSAMMELARQSFLQVSGPDPWIQGDLSPADHKRPRRLPFWERITQLKIVVDKHGKGRFYSSWHPTYNRYKAKATLVLVSDTLNDSEMQ